MEPEMTTRKTERTAKVQTIGTATILWITDKGQSTAYRVETIPSQLGGRAFQLSKADCGEGQPEAYSVLLDGARSTCDCPWGTFGANKKACRHVAGLSAVLARGQLF
jgi:hypothetical protein